MVSFVNPKLTVAENVEKLVGLLFKVSTGICCKTFSRPQGSDDETYTLLIDAKGIPTTEAWNKFCNEMRSKTGIHLDAHCVDGREYQGFVLPYTRGTIDHLVNCITSISKNKGPSLP